MFWFWVGIILILAAVLVPNEKYNWGSLLYSAINSFLAKREAKNTDFIFVGGSSYVVADLLA